MPEQAVLIITGAWHTAKHYYKLTDLFTTGGIRTICETLPTNNNAVPPNKTIHDDIAFIKAIVRKETENGAHLTVIAHSWGGMIASGALAEFAVTDDSPNGGVANLIFMCAFIPKENDSLAGLFGGTLPPYLTKEDNDLLVWRDPVDHLFNDLSAEEAQWADNLRVVHSTTAQHTALIVDKVAWRVIPLTYIICDNDQAMPPFVQTMMIDRVQAECISVKRFSIHASHSPFLSVPGKVADIVQEVMSYKIIGR